MIQSDAPAWVFSDEYLSSQIAEAQRPGVIMGHLKR